VSRTITVGAAQLGPIARDETRGSAVQRMLELMREAHARGCDIVVYPELALTSFFPRWLIEDSDTLDAFFEPAMPGPHSLPLFEEAARLRIGFYLGYAELAGTNAQPRRYNSSVLVDQAGQIVGKYRKIHLPGHAEHEPWRPFQHLEKRYFSPGDLGFPVWSAFAGVFGMCICNDRRWPETYRVMGLQNVEIILLGYNTPMHYPPVPQHDHLQGFHNHLVMQAGAYQNGTWVVAVAKAGCEEGCDLLGQSCIIAPTGEIVAMASTLRDELVVATCDLDHCRTIRQHIFNFSLHRRPREYELITRDASDSR
jgi:predicted amidohydrolase